MKAFSITVLMIFSTSVFADDFYARYRDQAADCVERARAAQTMSVYHFCVAGAVETLALAEPNDEQPKYAPLVTKFTARGKAWEQYENFLISETELNKTLGKIDRNE